MGTVWIGTWSGLARFDGVRFVVFDKFNTPAFRADAITALEVGGNGTLWIGTSDGLYSLAQGQLSRLGIEDGLPASKVWHLKASRTGGVWVQAGPGLAFVQDGRVAWERPDIEGRGTNYNAIRQFLAERDGALWLLMDRGVFEARRTAEAIKDLTPPALRGAWFRSALLGNDPEPVLVGTSAGVLARSGSEWRPLVQTDQAEQHLFHFVYRDPWGGLWCSSQERNLCRINNEQLIPVSWLGEHHFNAGCTLEDNQGGLWFGTDAGLFLLHRRLFRTYSMKDGLPNDQVWSVHEGKGGRIWVGMERGVASIEGDRVTVINRFEPARAVWETRAGQLFAGRGGVVYRLKGESLEYWLDEAQLGRGDVRALYEDHAGQLWLGTELGAAVVPDDIVSHVIPPRDLPFGRVRAVLEASSGTLWFGTVDNGLVRLEPKAEPGDGLHPDATSAKRFTEGQRAVFTVKEGLPSNSVWAIYEDADGVLWLGTENGLSRYTAGRFFNFNHAHGLREGVVNQVLEDDVGYLWLSGLRGIYRISREELNAVADGKKARFACAAFGLADGLESSETNGENQPADWKAHDGRLWFPTTRGVVVIDPRSIIVERRPMRPILEEVKSGGEVVYANTLSPPTPRAEGQAESKVQSANSKVAGGIPSDPQLSTLKPQLTPSPRLAPGQGHFLEFRFTAPNFVAPQRVSFLYRLAGYESKWHELVEKRVARYTNLRPGDYRFEFKARNHHGVWGEVPTFFFAFSLAPHFYESWAFYGLCGLGAVGLAGGVQAYRLRVQRRILQLNHERSLERERARIARDLHDDLGASLTGVALQLEAAQRRGGTEGEQLAALAGETRSLAHELRELAWTTNPRCDNASSLAAFIGELTERFCQAVALGCRLDLPAPSQPANIPARLRHELLVVLKESLANIAKHAAAREVTVGLALNNGRLELVIRDDGRGFEPARPASGTGLQNLRERVQQAGGSFTLESRPGLGTTVTVLLPLNGVHA